MSSVGNILVIDDDRDFALVYRDMFEPLGLEVKLTHSVEEAEAELRAHGQALDVVLLDQKLHGPGGGITGLELLTHIQNLAPFAKTLVVTGYASADAIERAFELGVYDYVVKNGAFEALLRTKVRNAAEVTRERRLAALTEQGVVQALEQVWQQVNLETDRNRKGLLLEELVKLLFRATPGFERVETRLTNDIEEIDIVVENRSDDPMWRNDGASYLLGECKNWSSRCGSSEFNSFHTKLTTKFGRARTGFFFAVGGFTEPFREAASRQASTNVLVIPVDGPALERWIRASDRLALLRELHRAAVFSLKG